MPIRATLGVLSARLLSSNHLLPRRAIRGRFLRMPAKAIALSRSVGDLLRHHRERLGYTLREVERLTSDQGNLIPFSTLARIEQGRLDPGLVRLQALLALYGLPMQAAGDLLDMEAIAGTRSAKGDFATLLTRGTEAWKNGDVPTAIACHLAMRRRASERGADRAKRHEAILSFAVLAAKLGKHHIARQMLDELLLDKPERPILFGIFLQAASTWQALGSPVLALALVTAAEGLVEPKDARGRGWVLHLRASIQIGLGAFEEAQTNLIAAAEAFRKARRPYDRALALVALARLEVERKRAAAGVRAARRAAAFASTKRFGRVHALACIQEARAHLVAGKPRNALAVLNGVLSRTVASSDDVICFYAHFYLSKVYDRVGDSLRSRVALEQAKHFVKFVDQDSAEAAEVRG
jgi:transcriptional regulator with XRE-family HTH domain